MQQINIYGCRGYLVSVALNQNTQPLYIVIIRVPFKFFNDPVQRQRTKHIEIHMHYIRQLVHDGTIHLLFCASLEQVADIFSNFFVRRHSKISTLLGIVDHAMKYD